VVRLVVIKSHFNSKIDKKVTSLSPVRGTLTNKRVPNPKKVQYEYRHIKVYDGKVPIVSYLPSI